MGKEKPGFLTAKAFSNRIKSKGLQKLRWFCQLCQKQCRDENGFKCHMTSESHHRQMMLFDENKDSVMSEYTRQFMRGYLDILKRSFGGKRTLANVVYQEYIKDKSHVHMNSTKFTTLTGFINCLQKMGVCAVDQTDKGWFIEYVAVDPETEHRESKKRRFAQSEMEDDEHFFDMITKRRKEVFDSDEKTVVHEELRKGEDERVSLSFTGTRAREKAAEAGAVVGCSAWADAEDAVVKETRQPVKPVESLKKTTVLEELRQETERLKERANRKSYWLQEGLVVKLIDERLPPELRLREVEVRKVEDRFAAVVRTRGLEGGERRMKVRQEHVMTVVPAVGGAVRVVNGGYRGERATVLKVDRRALTAAVEIVSGIHSGMRLAAVSHDDICKLAE